MDRTREKAAALYLHRPGFLDALFILYGTEPAWTIHKHTSSLGVIPSDDLSENPCGPVPRFVSVSWMLCLEGGSDDLKTFNSFWTSTPIQSAQ